MIPIDSKMRKAMSRKKGPPVSELSRDMYGFIVRPQHLQRYREFASIYKEEESERSQRWENFLSTCSSENNNDEIHVKNGEHLPLEEKQDHEAVKPRVVQRWCELRPSLNTIEQGLGKRVKDNQDSQKQDIDTENTNVSDDDSDDEFYDVDKSDGPSETSPAKTSSEDGDKTIPEDKPVPEEFPWRDELQFLVRGGVPMALRGELWQIFVATKARRIPGHYDALLAQLSNGNGNVSQDQNYVPVVEKWTSQIEKDLPRTFPGHPALDEDGRDALRRLLTAYARHNPDVGYCQAMNFFAALLLLLMPEENAFWTLIGIMDDYFEGYYSEKLLEAQVDQLVFEELARQHFPKLLSRLDGLGVQVPWISGPWFLSIFVNVLPWESVLRVWDVLLFEGNRSMLFRTALALLELHAPSLMAAHDAGDAISLMQTMAGSTFDSSQLVLTACVGYQSVDEHKLELQRDMHRPTVLATLHERALEMHLWRNSQGVLSKAKYSGAANGTVMTGEEEEYPEEDEELENGSDLQEQVAWLKNQLTVALEDRERATQRAEELDVALMEIVKNDNRRELSAKVEKLETEVSLLQQSLSDKFEQEKAMVQVMLKIEQEQKAAEDARHFAERDAAAHRSVAALAKEQYEEAMRKLKDMEARAVMAESMLEATLQYEAGQPGGNARRPAQEVLETSRWSWSRSPRDAASTTTSPKAETEDEPVRKPGLFSRMNWRDRANKVKSETPTPPTPSSNGTIEPEALNGDKQEVEAVKHEVEAVPEANGELAAEVH